MKMRVLLEGIGAALLLLFSDYLPFFNPTNHDLFHHGLPVTNLIGGLLFDLLGVSILMTGMLVAAGYLPPILQRLFNAMFAGLILWRIVNVAILVLFRLLFPVARLEHLWENLLLASLLLPNALAFALPRCTHLAARATRLTLAASALSACWIVPQLLYLALIRPPVQNAVAAHLPAPAQSNSSQRIIWILFDELSYKQVFEAPPAGLTLPNLHQLRQNSFSFSNLRPVGFRTDRIIPSLILGRRFDKFRSSVNGELSYWDESQNRWTEYDINETLFALAHSNGWAAGVDGWFNPYCPIFAPLLNACYWSPDVFPLEEFGASEDNSALVNAAAAPKQLWATVTNRNATDEEMHLMRFRNIMAHSGALIENSRLRFIFLHLPVPHPPGIYDRQRRVLRPGGSYFDNLALADETLGTLLREIDATPSASQTTVIVTSDHSWRISLYRDAEDWSAEEESASGGVFDDRPVLLIHFPGQQSGHDVPAAISEMIEHDVIVEMLRGKIDNQQDLAAFVAQQGH